MIIPVLSATNRMGFYTGYPVLRSIQTGINHGIGCRTGLANETAMWY